MGSWMDRWVVGRVGVYMYGCMYGWIYDWMGGLMVEWTGRWMNQQDLFFTEMPASGQPNKDLGVRGDVDRN